MATMHEAPARGLGLAGLLKTVRRRKILALVPFGFVLVAAAALALFLPSLWSARAVIMIDRQQIPESFVKPTVATDVESRLLTLSQEILSRGRLLEIIQRHNLYPKMRRAAPEELVEKMRKDIRIEFNDDRERRPKDTKTVAFSVAYTTTHPVVAMQVANTLAALYIAENTRLREKQAKGTSEFLDQQLADARKNLGEQEAKIAAYKEKYPGELPEQREMNMRTLERLQAQLQIAYENYRRAEERRRLINQSLAELDQSSGTSGAVDGGSSVTTMANAARLTLLRQELEQMQTKYSDRYPDVVYLKDQIKQLEARVADDAARPAKPAAQTARKRDAMRVIPQNPYIQSLMGQLDQASVEAKTGNEEVASLQRQIAVYQRRLESTPRREHELTLITRDYETTRDLFRSLLAKRDEAGIAANLEQRQKGEIFRIMDAAVTPDRPAGPNRLRLLLIGFVLAVTVSGAAVILAESADTSFRSVDEVRSRIAVPILSTIPKITTESDRFRLRRQRQLATAVMAVGLVVVLGSSFVIAHNNKELVDMLSVDTTSAKR